MYVTSFFQYLEVLYFFWGGVSTCPPKMSVLVTVNDGKLGHMVQTSKLQYQQKQRACGGLQCFKCRYHCEEDLNSKTWIVTHAF